MRPLLSTKKKFLWSSNHEQAFYTAKQSLTSAPTLSFYDPTRPTRLCTDTSRQGLGFVLQQHNGDQWTLVQAGSNFSRTCGFRHITSSPTYPQSNGKAEAAVKSMKKLIAGAWTERQIDHSKLAWALLQYRNTPSQHDGMSPAQRLLGRPLQDTIPAHQSVFTQDIQPLPRNNPMTDPTNQRYYNQ